MTRMTQGFCGFILLLGSGGSCGKYAGYMIGAGLGLCMYVCMYVFILSAISPYTTGLKALFNQSDCTGTAPTHK